jgi:glyoxylase-like metal-dependent hydrolase (beta-lactamase superfamily II)
MPPALTSITERVHMASTSLVNWTLVTGSSGVLLVDTGYPGNRDDVLTSLKKLGAGPEDVCAILLTHAHIDHFGSAIWFAQAHNTPVFCHAKEVGHAKREYLEQVSPAGLLPHIWQPRWIKWTLHIAGKGALNRAGIPTAQAFTEEIGENLPGRPMAVPTPGHTSGHCSYIVDGVLISGDALITGHPLARERGPQLLPSVFNHDETNCVRSLSALAMVETDVLVPGHGDIWIGPIRKAAENAAAKAAPGGIDRRT